MSSSRVHTTLTGTRAALATCTASLTKSEVGVAVQRCTGSRIPIDGECVPAELGAPEVLRDDGDPGRHLHHLLHAVDLLRLAAVERLHLPAEHGRARHDGRAQAGELHVHPE